MMAKETKDAKQAVAGTSNAVVGAIISFFFPGLGLLLSPDKKMLGIMVFIAVFIVDVVAMVVGGIGAAICFLPIVFFLAIPLAHLVAILHTYDVLTKEAGGNPILFK